MSPQDGDAPGPDPSSPAGDDAVDEELDGYGEPPATLAGDVDAPPPPRDVLSAFESAAGRGGPPPVGTYAVAPEAPSGIRRLLVLFALIAVALVLWFGRPVLMPLALAALLSFLLSPLCEWLERNRVPRALSVILVVTLAFTLIGALGWAVFNGVRQLGLNADRLRDNLVVKVEGLSKEREGGTIQNLQEAAEDVSETLEGTDKATDAAAGETEGVIAPAPTTTAPEGDAAEPATQPTRMEQLLLSIQQTLQAQAAQSDPERAAQIAEEAERKVEGATTQPARGSTERAPVFVTQVPPQLSPLERAGYLLSLAAGPLGIAGLVVVFTLFILLQRDDLRDRIIKLAAGRELNLATQALDDAATRITKYLVAMSIVNGTYGLGIGIGLELMAYFITGEHFPSIWLWALLCATLRFIPYIGPWVAAAFPLVVSVGWWPGYEMFFATAGLFVVVELVSNNVMEPILYGSSTGMSPVAVIVAAAFWTFVWGPAGLLMSTPLTTCLVVLGKYVPALRFFDILLGDEPVLKPHSRLYQRLLALDADDAADVLEEYREKHTLTETFDEVLLPALAMAERDRHAGRLTVERIEFIRGVTREIARDVGTSTEAVPSDSVDLEAPLDANSPARHARVVIIPSVDAADATAGQLLKYLLDRRGFETTALGEDELTSEKLEQVFAQHADVVVVSAVPPRATARARYLVKRLRQAQTQRGQDASGMAASAIVALWTCRSDLDRATQRLKSEGGDIRVVTTLADAVEAVRQRAAVAGTRRAVQTDKIATLGTSGAAVSTAI